jgi:2-desacetyl-2-hydroxyethyl bacteriochlorophyllide A dehydrogenase
MKAIELTKYGSPEFLQMKEVEKPSPKDHEILIKIHATSVSSGDARMRRADPFIIRLIFGFKRPRKPVLGVVVAGEIEAIGKRVTNYKVGDQVFGSSGMNFGAHAEYVAVSEDAVLALKPGNMSYEEAASIPFGATASMHFLRIAKIQQGQKVLIYGASGALGTMAVQLAKNYGADVTAVDSTRKLDMLRSIGADQVIDYTQEDFTKSGEIYDVIFDVVGTISISRSARSLSQNGTYLLANPRMSQMAGGLWTRMTSPKKVVMKAASGTTDDLIFLKELIEQGKIKSVIDRTYPLEQIAEAHRYVEKGGKQGNLVITVEHA